MTTIFDNAAVQIDAGDSPLRDFFDDTLEQADLIRASLGKKQAMLDDYLLCLLDTAHQILTSCAPRSGADVASACARLCLEPVQCEVRRRKKPQRLRVLMGKAPVQYRPAFTANYTALVGEYLESNAGEYFTSHRSAVRSMLSLSDLHEQSYELKALLGGSDALDALNDSFLRRLTIITATAVWAQSLQNRVLGGFTPREAELCGRLVAELLDGAR